MLKTEISFLAVTTLLCTTITFVSVLIYAGYMLSQNRGIYDSPLAQDRTVDTLVVTLLHTVYTLGPFLRYARSRSNLKTELCRSYCHADLSPYQPLLLADYPLLLALYFTLHFRLDPN